MSDTIKFRRYIYGPEIPMTDETDALKGAVHASEIEGDRAMPKLSGKVIDYGELPSSGAAKRLAEQCSHTMDAMRYLMLFGYTPPKPLTRRERIERWFVVRWERVVTAWKVLRGDDIHVEED